MKRQVLASVTAAPLLLGSLAVAPHPGIAATNALADNGRISAMAACCSVTVEKIIIKSANSSLALDSRTPTAVLAAQLDQ